MNKPLPLVEQLAQNTIAALAKERDAAEMLARRVQQDNGILRETIDTERAAKKLQISQWEAALQRALDRATYAREAKSKTERETHLGCAENHINQVLSALRDEIKDAHEQA